MNHFNTWEELDNYCMRRSDCNLCEAYQDNLDVCNPNDSSKITFEKLLIKKRKEKLKKLLDK